MVAVAVGVHRLRSATEGGQRINCAGDAFYLFPRQFAGAQTAQYPAGLFILKHNNFLLHFCFSKWKWQLTVSASNLDTIRSSSSSRLIQPPLRLVPGGGVEGRTKRVKRKKRCLTLNGRAVMNI